MMETEHRGIVVPAAEASESIVVRWPAGVIVLDGSHADIAGALRALRPEGEPEPASGLLIERLRMLRLADLAAGVSTPGGVRLLSSGRGTAGVGATQAADQSVGGSTIDDDGFVLREVDVALGASPIWIGIGAMDEGTLQRTVQRTSLDFSGGVVPGRGLVLVRPLAAPLDPRPRDQRSFDLVDFGAASEDATRDPLPIQQTPEPDSVEVPVDDSSDVVLGIRCSRDHFNNPSAAYCQVCGISMVHITHHLVRGERPTLGFLVFDDGATFALDRSYVIGREPTVASDSALAPLTADDNEHTVSRSHAELVLDGWDVTVADLGSTNGTFVWDAGRREWERVLPNRPVVVAPGTSVAVGRKTFVYEPVARSV